MKPIYLSLIILSAFSCTKDAPVTYKEPVNAYFSLTLPSGWYLSVTQGIDTYCGYYHNGRTKFYFDCGNLSFGSIGSIQKNSRTIYYEEMLIDNCPAKIVKEVRDDGTRLSAFIDKDDGEHRTSLSSYEPVDDEMLIRIFKSHKFK